MTLRPPKQRVSRLEMDRLLALHDRWSTYDALVAILTFTAGVVLVLIGIVAVVAGASGLGPLVTFVGAGVALFGLHKEPYQAR